MMVNRFCFIRILYLVGRKLVISFYSNRNSTTQIEYSIKRMVLFFIFIDYMATRDATGGFPLRTVTTGVTTGGLLPATGGFLLQATVAVTGTCIADFR